MPKVDCKYGKDCYQKNAEHKNKYNHPDAESEQLDPLPDDKANRKRSRSPTDETSSSKQQATNVSEPAESATEHPFEIPKNVRTEFPIPEEYGYEPGHMFDIYDPQIKYSQKKEYQELLADPKVFIRHKFLVEMPTDFYKFWDFCKTIVKEGEQPETVFECVGLKLVGAFDVLAGKFNNAKMFEPGEYLRHWRFYYDVPEFQTVLVKAKTGLHFGYWRDDPKSEQCFIAKNDANKNCEIELVASNIFQAVIHILDNHVTTTPFNKPQVTALKKSIIDWCATNEIKLDDFKELLKIRDKSVVCKSFHKAGIVVPFDRKKDVGYRELSANNQMLKQILATFNSIDTQDPDTVAFAEAMESLQPIITFAFIAVDECDFGTALELGIDLFCHGTKNLHAVLRPLLIAGYTMTQRPQYIAIMKSHLDDRRKTIDLDLLAT